MFNIYAVLTPIAISLVIFEMLYCWLAKKNYYSFQDAVSSFATAIGNQIVNLAVAALVMKSYGYLYHNFSPWKLEINLINSIILLVFGALKIPLRRCNLQDSCL